MTEENEQQPPWGAPQQPPQDTQPRWSWRKSMVAVLVAAGLAAGGGVAVYAASGSASADGGRGGGPMGYWRMDGPPFGPPMDGRGPGAGLDHLMNAVHGEFVVSDGNGGYTTMLTQVGELTEASEDSLTVRSADGFTQTYAVDADTERADVQTGDTVRVIATKAGETATADHVTGGPGTRPAPPTR